MTRAADQLDLEAIAERQARVRSYLIGGVVVATLLALLFASGLVGPSEEASGTVLALSPLDTETGSRFVATVRMDSGAEVRALVPINLPLRVGASVTVASAQQVLAAGSRHRVVSVLDP